MTPRIGSLCSGAGGLDLAVEHVTGGRTIWHAEYDDDAAKVLETRWPGIPNHRDITSVDWSRVEPADIVCAGYPCQPFSAAGERKGTDDERHLWPYVAEAIRVLRPRLVILENVAGHRSLGFDCVLADLAEMRYDAQWCSIRASDVGAPHRRERIFVVAYPEGDRWDQGWPEPAGFVGRSNAAVGGVPAAADTEGGSGSHEQGCGDAQGFDVLAKSGAGDRDSARGAASRVHQLGRSTGELAAVDLLPTPTASRYPSNRSPSMGAAVRPSLDSITDLLPTPGASDGSGGRSARVTGGVRPSGAKRSVPLTDLPLLLPTPKATDAHSSSPADLKRNDPGLRAIDGLLPTPCVSDATGGGAHPDSREGHSRQLIDYALLDGTPQWGKYEPAIRRWESITRTAPAPTETGARGNPRLAAAFSEWMQGWALGWVTHVDISRSAMLRIIGNGVVPQQAIAALYWLLSVSEVAA